MHTPQQLNHILGAFKLSAECLSSRKVRNIAFYDLRLRPGTLIRSIDRYSAELSVALRSRGKPILRVVPEEGIVRMEVVESPPERISLMTELSRLPRPEGAMPQWLGSGSDGVDIWTDLSRHPHTLIAGTTGSGKSTLLHTIVANALHSRDTDLYLIDTKGTEFGAYTKTLPRTSVADQYRTAVSMVQFLTVEMERRYQRMRVPPLLSSVFRPPPLRNILLIIDEFADLILQDRDRVFATLLCGLAQKCRAARIHCVLATQRPSADIISGAIKANFPARIACQVASAVDSRVVLDQSGAERLAGNGDAIIKTYGYDYKRFQVAYTDQTEVIGRYAS